MRKRTVKRRFGISIPEELAKYLDILADILRTDRSRLVCEALEKYIHDHMDYIAPHECYGVMTIAGLTNSAQLMEIIEENRDVICGYTHTHTKGECIELIIVSGPSSRIAELHRRFLEIPKCRVRYMPVKMKIMENL